VLAIGTVEEITSSVMVCDRKVITTQIGKQVISGLLTLIAVHYTYELQYNQLVQEVMCFIQEKLLGHPLPATQKVLQAYSNLSRSIACIESTLEPEVDDDGDEDETQAFCELK